MFAQQQGEFNAKKKVQVENFNDCSGTMKPGIKIMMTQIMEKVFHSSNQFSSSC